MPLGLAAFGNLPGILTSPCDIATYLTLTVSYSILFSLQEIISLIHTLSFFPQLLSSRKGICKL